MCPDQNLVFSRLLFYPLYLSEYEYRDSSVKVWCLHSTDRATQNIRIRLANNVSLFYVLL